MQLLASVVSGVSCLSCRFQQWGSSSTEPSGALLLRLLLLLLSVTACIVMFQSLDGSGWLSFCLLLSAPQLAQLSSASCGLALCQSVAAQCIEQVGQRGQAGPVMWVCDFTSCTQTPGAGCELSRRSTHRCVLCCANRGIVLLFGACRVVFAWPRLVVSVVFGGWGWLRSRAPKTGEGSWLRVCGPPTTG